MFIIVHIGLRFPDAVGMGVAPVVANASVLIHLSRIGQAR